MLFLSLSTGVFSQEFISKKGYQKPPEEIKNLILAPRHENVTLSNLSPDRTLFLNTIGDGLTPISRLAKPYQNLGGIEIDTAANRQRSFTTGGSVGYELIPRERGRTRPILTPDEARVSHPRWSPDGTKIAYFAHYENETHIYVADVSIRRSTRITNSPVLPILTTIIEWSGDSKHITTIIVPGSRKPKPQPGNPADKFLIRISTEGNNHLRTFPNLLEGNYEKSLLKYYGTGQLAKINVETNEVNKIGDPGLYSSISMAPDGEYLRVTTIEKPFSNIVPVSRFADINEVWNVEGEVMAEISRRDIRDGSDDSKDNDEPEKRQIRWRPDGEGISFLQKEVPPEKVEEKEEEELNKLRDQVIKWVPPYGEDDKEVIYKSENEIRSLEYSEDCQILFITERKGGEEHLYAVFLDEPEENYTIYKWRTRDLFKDPGNLMTTDGELGERIARISTDGNLIYLSGTRYHEDWLENAPQPFIDKIVIRSGESTRVFESEKDVFERVLAVLDDDMNRLVISRETPTKTPDSYLRDNRDGSTHRLTNNVDHSPQITNAQHHMFKAKRSDGITFHGRAILPSYYEQGEKLPTIFWHYPREYEDQDSYDKAVASGGGRYRTNINSFLSPHRGARSTEFLITQGYAVILTEFPIIGPLDEINDNFVPSIQRNWTAIIDACDELGFIDRERLGLGGHSYGAFGTANSMIHTSFFKAGIAGAGNYNRSLTPMTFQRERRILWESREIYITMSPIFWAERLDGALLMYHGADDTNSGTWPTNSKRFFHALNGLGKTTALYFYPYEGHGPSSRETLLDMWARWFEWVEVYVKNANDNN